MVGPIFSREALTTPRTLRHFATRTGYLAAFLVLFYTLGQITFGWQQGYHLGELARFGNFSFQVFSLVQLTLMIFLSLIFAAGNVSIEKDRKTLILLLMTDLRDSELVLGKLSASLLSMGVILGVSIPLLASLTLLGGVSPLQVFWSLAITGSAMLVSGSWGNFVAFWREKTFQTLAVSVLGLVLFLGVVELLHFVFPGPVGSAIGCLNPYRGMLMVLDPLSPRAGLGASPASYCGMSLALSLILNLSTILGLRVWNPSDARVWPKAAEDELKARRGHDRAIWSNPIVWREIVTKGYGRKVIFIKAAYIALFATVFWGLLNSPGQETRIFGLISLHGFAFVGLSILSLLLINAQSVTALTSERDGKTLELLLVTEITPVEFIFGKLLGVAWNAKEVLLLPLTLTILFVFQGILTVENLIYVWMGFLVLATFAAVLGLHSGLTFENSRSAIASSLGTMFFLFLGIFLCMMLILEARSSFWLQLPSFLVFILGGSLGLAASLTHKNPSPALSLSAFLLPFFTFYSITAFILQETLSVCLVMTVTYGFTTVAMLVPAISEFDVAFGRATRD